jgi:hypothetical protein
MRSLIALDPLGTGDRMLWSQNRMLWSRIRGAIAVAAIVPAAASCYADAQPVAVAPAAQDVEVGKADPPGGSRSLGPVEAVHGDGCGGFGTKGSYESALAVLRNKAQTMGGNYVQVMTMTEPHSENGCFDDRFVIRGVVFRLGAAPAAASVTAATSDGCDPPCSPGYACQAGVCHALCNPKCGANEVCRQDRTCGPAGQ